MKIWPFLLLSSALLATVNEPLRFEWSTGYRNDRIHWHLQNPGEGAELTYSELNHDVQFWENAVTLKTIYRDLVFFVRGAYGIFGRGTLFQKYADLDFTAGQPHFEFNTNGWSADASGYFGYAVNLTTDRTYKIILIPLIGYDGHFEKLERKDPSPNPLESDDAVGANSLSMTSHAGKLHMNWNGVYLGVNFLIEPGNGLILNAGYARHWIHMKVHTSASRNVSLGTPLASEQIASFSMKANHGGNVGQTGWAQLDFILDRFWRAGIGGMIHYFSSQVADTTLHQEVQTVFPAPSTTNSDVPQKFKLRWTTVSGWAQISRSF